jgi:ribonuclease T1
MSDRVDETPPQSTGSEDQGEYAPDVPDETEEPVTESAVEAQPVSADQVVDDGVAPDVEDGEQAAPEFVSDPDWTGNAEDVDPAHVEATKQNAEGAAQSLRETGQLDPAEYATKAEARANGWTGGPPDQYTDGRLIGGSPYQNREGLFDDVPGENQWFEADIGTDPASARGTERLCYSDTGHMYVTNDHYDTAHYLGRYK